MMMRAVIWSITQSTMNRSISRSIEKANPSPRIGLPRLRWISILHQIPTGRSLQTVKRTSTIGIPSEDRRPAANRLGRTQGRERLILDTLPSMKRSQIPSGHIGANR